MGNTRQKIVELLNQNKKVSEIVKILKGEPVSNLRAYVYSTRASLKSEGGSKAYKRRTSLRKLNKVGQSIELKCAKCKRTFEIRVNDIEIYTKEVRVNWRCLLCCRRRK